MPKIILTKEEKNCAEFLGLEVTNISNQDYKLIKDTLLNQELNKNNPQASSSSKVAKESKKKIDRDRIDLKKKVDALQKYLQGAHKEERVNTTGDIGHLRLRDYIDPNSSQYCNFCCQCNNCLLILKAYDQSRHKLTLYQK